jgi:transcriptional regulator with XRE-family HTH domain
MNSFEEWIDKELYKRGWSRREAARRAGISASMMNKVINQEANPGISFYRGIAEAFGISIVEVLAKAGELQDHKHDELTEEAEFLMSQLSPYQRQLAVKFIRVLAEEKGGYNVTGNLVEDEQK